MTETWTARAKLPSFHILMFKVDEEGSRTPMDNEPGLPPELPGLPVKGVLRVGCSEVGNHPHLARRGRCVITSLYHPRTAAIMAPAQKQKRTDTRDRNQRNPRPGLRQARAAPGRRKRRPMIVITGVPL